MEQDPGSSLESYGSFTEMGRGQSNTNHDASDPPITVSESRHDDTRRFEIEGGDHNLVYSDFADSGSLTEMGRGQSNAIHDASDPPVAVSESRQDDTRRSEIEELRKQQDKERETLVLSQRPLATLRYFLMAMLQLIGQAILYIASHKFLLLVSCFAVIGWRKLNTMKGPHEQFMQEASIYLRYVSWWVGLGIASSIGLGSGLHTFVLYLGPHIAMFTLKATLCGRVDLKTAAYDTAIFGKGPTWEFKNCLDFGDPLYPRVISSGRYNVPLLDILQEVHWEAVLWGAGTALGELPPYFVSRAARLSGDSLRKVEDLGTQDDPEIPRGTISGLVNKLKLWTLLHFRQFNFWTILIFASVPNPLFDLAGMMCGQLNVKFWKFFVPTLIGKAIIKTHIQTLFVIALCNNQLIEQLELILSELFKNIPFISRLLNGVLLHLQNAKQNYDSGPSTKEAATWKFSPALIWNLFVWIMLLCFICSIINATAQRYLLEIQTKKLERLRKKE
ncbi:hypothetical protein KP509_25G003200 [Ceratopteris richardii]|uniref:Vacuole membrane protein KMS1 n=1 Tax=Ceratopteris richardii TaxID=49495 RepID=A0A8T2RNL5_CERRI|nr:hypothetical protein KP509_25G003200 [Ceratopteris richardii]